MLEQTHILLLIVSKEFPDQDSYRFSSRLRWRTDAAILRHEGEMEKLAQIVGTTKVELTTFAVTLQTLVDVSGAEWRG